MSYATSNPTLPAETLNDSEGPPADQSLDFAVTANDKISGQVISVLGLAGFLMAWGISYLIGPMEPSLLFLIYAGLTATPMVFAILFVNKEYRRPTSGLVEKRGPLNWRRSFVKLLGLLSTLFILYGIYELLPERGKEFYRPAGQLIIWFVAPFLLLAIPYFVWVDCYMIKPEDGYWHMGSLILGRFGKVSWSRLKDHALDWLIKAYFLPFMLAGSLIHLKMLSEKGLDFSAFGYFYVTSMNFLFAVDICFGAIGYLLTFRILDGQIRSSEPTWLGWLSAIMCYAPIAPFIWGNYLKYEGKTDWQEWLIPYPIVYISWGFFILVLLFIYTWSTCSFGCRFSNLTNRGIIVDGPYRYTKHPAYLSKNIAWWLMAVPFVAHATWIERLTACLCLFITNLVYVIRALTEERHLMRNPAYVAYAAWINRNGLLTQLSKGLRRDL